MRIILFFMTFATNCIGMLPSDKIIHVSNLADDRNKQAQISSLLTAYVNGKLEAKEDGTLLYSCYNDPQLTFKDTIKAAQTVLMDVLLFPHCTNPFGLLSNPGIYLHDSSEYLKLRWAMRAFDAFLSCSDIPAEEIKNNRIKLNLSFPITQDYTDAELPKIASNINAACKKPLGFSFDLNNKPYTS